MAGHATANPDIICRSTNVGPMVLSQILRIPGPGPGPAGGGHTRIPLAVPLFQRRYVWGRTEWACMLRDASRLHIGGRHHLGAFRFYSSRKHLEAEA